MRGGQLQGRAAHWSRWFPQTPTVDAALFQSTAEPHPGHWREFPEPWPPLHPADPDIASVLFTSIGELPRVWRELVVAHDVSQQSTAEPGHAPLRTIEQERAIRNRAYARLRERLGHYLTDAPRR